jgi:hypothetical protein
MGGPGLGPASRRPARGQSTTDLLPAPGQISTPSGECSQSARWIATRTARCKRLAGKPQNQPTTRLRTVTAPDSDGPSSNAVAVSRPDQAAQLEPIKPHGRAAGPQLTSPGGPSLFVSSAMSSSPQIRPGTLPRPAYHLRATREAEFAGPVRTSTAVASGPPAALRRAGTETQLHSQVAVRLKYKSKQQGRASSSIRGVCSAPADLNSPQRCWRSRHCRCRHRRHRRPVRRLRHPSRATEDSERPRPGTGTRGL